MSVNATLHWVNADNSKTGRIPTAYVGKSVAEAKASCTGCPLLRNGCYAWSGTPNLAFTISTDKAQKRGRGRRFTFDSVFKRRRKDARAIRLGALGDPARAKRASLLHAIARTRSAGLAVLGYTHFWYERGNRELRKELMASVGSLQEARKARKAGWVPALIVPSSMKNQVWAYPRYPVCPAIRKPDAVTCNQCRLCDPQNPAWSTGKVDGIAFPGHGPLEERT